MKAKIKRAAKAVVAALVAGVAVAVTALPDGIDPSEAGLIVAAALGAWAATYRVPNTPPA